MRQRKQTRCVHSNLSPFHAAFGGFEVCLREGRLPPVGLGSAGSRWSPLSLADRGPKTSGVAWRTVGHRMM
jgi:hypothetical protein